MCDRYLGMRDTVIWAVWAEGKIIDYVETKREAKERRRVTYLPSCETQISKVVIPGGGTRQEEVDRLNLTLERRGTVTGRLSIPGVVSEPKVGDTVLRDGDSITVETDTAETERRVADELTVL